MVEYAQAQTARRVTIFAFDSAEISQIRRIEAFRRLGHEVMTYSFRRGDPKDGIQTSFPNVHLYWSKHAALGHRLFLVMGAIIKMMRHRADLRRADVIIARNLDMLLIAWAARGLSGARQVPLVYECLDIHRAMTRTGIPSRILRGIERALLRRCAMLATSSPAFASAYFGGWQGYAGPVAVWENRIQPNARLPKRPTGVTARADGPVRIGLMGALRCEKSMRILAAAAEAMDGALEIELHGIAHRHALPDFDAIVAECPAMRYCGPYAYPDDLLTIYGGVDLVWNADFQNTSAKSAWALSNRIYEASWAGCPSIGVAGSAMGDRIRADALGWVLETPTPEALVQLLRQLSLATLREKRQALLAMDASAFVSTGAELQSVVDELCPAPRAAA